MSIPTKANQLPQLDAPDYFILGRSDGRYGKESYSDFVDSLLAAVNGGFPTRAAFIAAQPILNLIVQNGQTVTAGGLSYMRQTGATAIPDMPGWVPVGDIRPEHMGPVDGLDDQDQINAAIRYADSIGGGEVHLRGQVYLVWPSGTWSTANGDLNCCVRVETQNPVWLRGVWGVTEIRQAGTRIAHTLSFGRRVGPDPIPAKGGYTGINITGNRPVAVEEPVPVPYSGGCAVNFAGPGAGIRVSGTHIKEAYSYGCGFQRSYWDDCVFENFVIEDCGNDGLDAKYDHIGDIDGDAVPTAGSETNIIRNGRIERVAQRYAELVGQKAALDLRVGWRADNIAIVIDTPCVGARLQVPDPTASSVPPDPERLRASTSLENVSVRAEGVKTGTDGGGTSLEALCFQAGVDGVTLTNVRAVGGRRNYWIRSSYGKYSGVYSRDAEVEGISIWANAGAIPSSNTFTGLDLEGSPIDLRLWGSGVTGPVGTSFFGGRLGVVSISAEVEDTAIMGARYTSLTDAGVNTLVLTPDTPARFRAGRNAVQHVEISGDGGGNRILSVSTAGAPKPLNLASDKNVLNLIGASGVQISVGAEGAPGTAALSVIALGDVRLASLPTSEPTTAGRLWRDGNIIKIKV